MAHHDALLEANQLLVRAQELARQGATELQALGGCIQSGDNAVRDARSWVCSAADRLAEESDQDARVLRLDVLNRPSGASLSQPDQSQLRLDPVRDGAVSREQLVRSLDEAGQACPAPPSTESPVWDELLEPVVPARKSRCRRRARARNKEVRHHAT